MSPPPAAALLQWYDRHRRSMPWRALPGETADPYRVWLSEVMLQQTTVVTVIPYFLRFLARFPTVSALATADSSEVMEAWAGLGYYARARNLHACAQAVARAGGFPLDEEGLRALPGIGIYTAAAIASIAFGVPVIPVDGNIERVAARMFGISDPLPSAKAAIAGAAAHLGADEVAQARPSDFTQALFDLGATICTPRAPACGICPWQIPCVARQAGDPARLPVKAPRRVRPLRHGIQFWLEDEAGSVLLRRRPPSGLLGGMLELPGSTWRTERWVDGEVFGQAPQAADWVFRGVASHAFTHFELELQVFSASVASIQAEGLLVSIDSLPSAALPTVMRRCVDLVLAKTSAAASHRVKTFRA